MILAPRKERNEIMKAISQRCGAKTEAQGITLSLPVDGVFGLSEAIKEKTEDFCVTSDLPLRFIS